MLCDKREKVMLLFLKKAFRIFRKCFYSALLFYPRRVKCNICGWKGRRFLSDSWHRFVNCPGCMSGVRQRLFFAALEKLDLFSFERLFNNKRVLHFAPEEALFGKLKAGTALYNSADLFRSDCDLRLNMADMPEIESNSYDVVIAFDVLEHICDYEKALDEVFRILDENGTAIFTVPQKDFLEKTYEDSSLITPEERLKHFGQFDHVRIFGNDFEEILSRHGFSVLKIDENDFEKDYVRRHILCPPVKSKHPLATNFRKVFFW